MDRTTSKRMKPKHAPDIIEVLNPADSFTLAMDEEIRNDGLAGSYGCLALELSHLPDMTVLQQRIQELADRFPSMKSCLQQRGRRYYWCQRSQPTQLFFHHTATDEEDESYHHQLTQRIVNAQCSREETNAIEFHLISSRHKQTFFMRWLHPLCDARGADLILNYLCSEPEQRKQFGLPATPPLVFVQLNKFPWWQKISLLIKGKRYIDKLDQQHSIQSFDCTRSPQQLNYSIQRLSVDETQKVLVNARQSVGITGTSLYYIGCFMRALATVFPDQPGDAYCAPYAFNLRKQKALTPITGNHISALFAQAPRSIVADRQALFAYLKQQHAQVIRNQQDYAFLPLMWAGSWLSLKEYGKILRLSSGSGQERSSFWFSDIGRVNLPSDRFPGAQVTKIYPVCQVTTPPGLAFLTCIYADQLTLSYNFVEPICDVATIHRLHAQVAQELLNAN